MAGRRDRPFIISIDAAFTETGVWLIEARLRFRDGIPPRKSPLLREARQALQRRIAWEKRRGRFLGANRIRVHMRASDFAGAAVPPGDD